MIQANSWLALLPAADSSFWMLVVAAVGIVAGRLLTSCVGGLLDSGAFDYEEHSLPVPAGNTDHRRWIVVVVAAAAVGLWWWEVRRLGLGPVAGGRARSRCLVCCCSDRGSMHRAYRARPVVGCRRVD